MTNQDIIEMTKNIETIRKTVRAAADELDNLEFDFRAILNKLNGTKGEK